MSVKSNKGFMNKRPSNKNRQENRCNRSMMKTGGPMNRETRPKENKSSIRQTVIKVIKLKNKIKRESNLKVL